MSIKKVNTSHIDFFIKYETETETDTHYANLIAEYGHPTLIPNSNNKVKILYIF